MIEDVVKRLGRRAGVEISHYRPFGARRAAELADHSICTVMDVGANTGDYAAELRAFGYMKRIISFEPLAAAFSELENRARQDASWECFNFAVGNVDGEAAIHVASNLASSSLLEMTDEHRSGAPDVSFTGQERVTLQRLDSLALDIKPPAMLKLDVQGYEHEVLKGARNTLPDITLVECELSIMRLYQGQPSIAEMIDSLCELGFELVDLEPIFFRQSDGRTLSVDGLFSRLD